MRISHGPATVTGERNYEQAAEAAPDYRFEAGKRSGAENQESGDLEPHRPEDRTEVAPVLATGFFNLRAEMTAKTIMIQGTGSHVGKSYLAAGLCRIFRDEGRRVAPFKSQNMALNSFATIDGREIGRAQAVQAMAAGITPSVDMNPILLKPEAGGRAQVIINGLVEGSMDSGVYHSMKRDWSPLWRQALSRLREEYELVVIEGAGSPAEINLADRDVANMAVAAEAEAPVLLVADIERGGAFASLFGTYALLSPGDRRRIKGFIINKMHGDAALLAGGPEFLEEETGVPVLGIVPFIDAVLEEEDSAALDKPTSPEPADSPLRLRVVVPRLPGIANFTDLEPLALLSEIDVAYVDEPAAFEPADAVVLPGSKNTIADLRWLKSRGLDHAIIDAARRGVPTLGLCGGYQMLGAVVRDPLGVEGPVADFERGLDLLPIESEMSSSKRVRQTGAVVTAGETVLGSGAAGVEVTGYEIHVGRSMTIRARESEVVTWIERDGESLGWAASRLPVAGTYLHGLFGNQVILGSFVDLLADQAGRARFVVRPDRFEARIDRIATVLRGSLDMPRIAQLIEEGTAQSVGAGIYQ